VVADRGGAPRALSWRMSAICPVAEKNLHAPARAACDQAGANNGVTKGVDIVTDSR
jgi:hypothetical protein